MYVLASVRHGNRDWTNERTFQHLAPPDRPMYPDAWFWFLAAAAAIYAAVVFVGVCWQDPFSKPLVYLI